VGLFDWPSLQKALAQQAYSYFSNKIFINKKSPSRNEGSFKMLKLFGASLEVKD
jgi:hypothetical protein